MKKEKWKKLVVAVKETEDETNLHARSQAKSSFVALNMPFFFLAFQVLLRDIKGMSSLLTATSILS